MHKHFVMIFSYAILLPWLAQCASADVICEWNATTIELSSKGFTNYATRINAMESIAVYNSVASIDHCGPQYHDELSLDGPASTDAAAATAAHDVLAFFYPASEGELDDRLDASLKSLSVNAQQVKNGCNVGTKAAAHILSLRQNDGSATSNQNYLGSDDRGKWRPTPRAFSPTIVPQWATMTPFVLEKPNQFRPSPPPVVDSVEFKKALAEIKAIGGAKSTVRTQEQTNIAQFWKQSAEVPPNQAARDLATVRGMKIDDEAKMFALLNMAMADICIADWDAKITYSFWRPVTALNADADGKVTNDYTAWIPLLNTPPHPSYVCNHCGVSSAGFEVLIHLLGDTGTVTFHTTTTGQADRKIRMSEAIHQVAMSRLYGGIHYRFDNEEGDALGKKVADYVLDHGLPAKQ